MANAGGARADTGDSDALMDRLFKLCKIDPEGYLAQYGGAVQFVQMNNVSCKDWFRQRDKGIPS